MGAGDAPAVILRVTLNVRRMFARPAFRFVFMMGLVSLFADMAYEGGRSVSGPFLAHLGATGLVVGLVAGFGEFIGFGLRYASGTFADRTRAYWATTFAGYLVNVFSVPALGLAQTWQAAAGLIVGERFGRGIRKPTAGALVAHAGSELGQGWVFGFREAMDQTGATIGPLIIALVLYLHLGFHLAFGVLAIPAALAIVALVVAQRQFPRPQELEVKRPGVQVPAANRAFWFYVAGGACLGAGFADFALVSYHLSRAHVIGNAAIPVLYAAAMLVGAFGAPLIGRWYDRFGMPVVTVTFFIAAFSTPLAFLGNAPWAIAGVLLWGLGMVAQDALLPSIIAGIAPPDRRATALGFFDAVYGTAWFAGSAAMGALYDHDIAALVIFALVLQLFAGLPLMITAGRASSRARP